MDNYQLITSILSAISIVISLLAFLNSLYSKKISQGQIELQIHQHICESENNLLNVMIKEKDFTDKQYFSEILKISLQFHLNAYEEACSKYIDKKIDRKRFKKNYYAPICNIVKCGSYDDFLEVKKTNYHALLKVYNEWINLEK